MSVEFDSPANRVIAQQQPKNKFRIDTSLPDISFLRQLAVQGRLIYKSGSAGAGNNDLLELVPTNGSTVFIYKMIFSSIAAGALFRFFNDDQERLVIDFTGDSTSAGEFTFMDALVGDGIKKYLIRTGVTLGTARASIFGWVENTSRIRDVTN